MILLFTFGRLANAWEEGTNHIVRDLASVTEVEVLVKRVVGYSGPDDTITTTVLGSPTCSATPS
jgi:hypothetical protein